MFTPSIQVRLAFSAVIVLKILIPFIDVTARIMTLSIKFV
jgi:hypothetical protein